MEIDEILATVAEVEVFTAATELLPALRIVAHEASEKIAAVTKHVVVRGIGFMGVKCKNKHITVTEPVHSAFHGGFVTIRVILGRE